MAPKDFDPQLSSDLSLDIQAFTYAKTGTGLDYLVDQALKDPGLNLRISDAEIQAGATAAAGMNAIIVEAIRATGVANDGSFRAADMHLVSDWIVANRFEEFKTLHGDDDNGTETGYHLIQNDGSSLHIFGDNLVNQVADSIYHLGFATRDNRLQNEDGQDNARAEKVAYWLNEIMAADLQAGTLAGGPANPIPNGTTGTGLDQLVGMIADDARLDRSIRAEDIKAGATAADTMNQIIVDGIKALGLVNNGALNTGDIMDLSDWIMANRAAAWKAAHGDDETNVETGFHLVRGDGAITRLFSFNGTDTVADGVYHIGFGYKHGYLVDEDGNGNVSLSRVAYWLNQLLADDINSGSLTNPNVDPYPVGNTNTGLDQMVDLIVTDPGLARNYKTSELAKIARDVDGLNKIVVEGINATGIAKDGNINALDIMVLSKWIKDNKKPEWKALRGDDDAGTGVMGLVWTGATNQIAGENAINSFAENLYSLGYTHKWGGIIDEDGDWVGVTDDLAAALNTVLAQDLADGSFSNPGQAPKDPATFASDIVEAVDVTVNVTDDDNYHIISSSSALKLASGTVAFSFVAEDISPTRSQALFARDADGSNVGDTLVYFYDGKLYAKISKGGENKYIEIPHNIIEGQAHDFAMTFDNSGVSFWLDGVLSEYRTDVQLTWLQNTKDIVVGASNGYQKPSNPTIISSEFQGEISGFTVYDRVLDRSEIEGLSGGTSYFGNATDENIVGTDGQDALHGDLGQDVIVAGDGDDAAYGGYGADLIKGGKGNDLLDGGHGQDSLNGGDGNDVLLSTSDAREQVPGQLQPGYAKTPRPDNGDLDPATGKLYPDQPIPADDTLTGGSGADTFRFQFLINAKYDIIQKHVQSDGSINWRGVAGENTYIHDHWVDHIGDDVITDFNRAEGDKIEIAGHTLNINQITYHDSNQDGIDDYTKITFISRQGNGGGAHDEDDLGSVTVYGDLVQQSDITQIPSNTVFYGIVENVSDIDEAITPLSVDGGTPRADAGLMQTSASGPRGASDTSGGTATAPAIAAAPRGGTGLDAMLDWIETDTGLINSASPSDIEAGAKAAAGMNAIIVEAIKATSVANDGAISTGDVYLISDWIKANRLKEWKKFHGDDENGVETGFHLVQGDGAVVRQFGVNGVNTAADAIYHLGFGYRKGRLINEDAQLNERVEEVAYWLDQLLADDLAAGSLNGGGRSGIAGSTGTGLDQLVDKIVTDSGLARKITPKEIDAGAGAADQMNKIIIQSIKATGIANNGEISEGDVKVLADYIKANHASAWKTAHGNDEGNVETGFHKVQGDGSYSRLYGNAAVDTVADGIYHLGFGYRNGVLINEDGNGNASLSDVAGWLESLLADDLASGALSNPSAKTYVSGTTGTGFDILVQMVTDDVGLGASLKTKEIATAARAADGMNKILLEGIKATGIANDGKIDLLDVINLDAWVKDNYDAEHRKLNGPNGWDVVEIWNSTSPIFGRDGVNEVADAIYSIGFGTRWGNSQMDENGNWTAALDDTASWLSGILSQDLSDGSLFSKALAYTDPSQFDGDIIAQIADLSPNGSVGWVNVKHNTGLELNSGTVSFEFQANTAASSTQVLFSKDARDYGNGGHTQIYIENGELWVRVQSKSKSFWLKADLDAPIAAGVTYEVALIFGSEGLKLFVDGAQVISDPKVKIGWQTNQEDMVFGASGDWRNSKYPDHTHSVFDGKIANVAIYDRPLHIGEIAGLYGVNTDVVGSGTSQPVDPILPVDPTPPADATPPVDANPPVDATPPADPTPPVDPTPTVDPTPPVDANPPAAPTPPVDQNPPSGPNIDGLTLTGDASNNKLTGSNKNDLIDGKGGNDKIDGGAGDDIIIAGAGKDGYVKGGTGADIFRFGLDDGDIKIFDWEDGIDKVELTGGLRYADLTQSYQVYNGVTTVIFKSASGDRIMFRDQNPSDIDANDFKTASGTGAGTGAGSGGGSSTDQSPVPISFNRQDYDSSFIGDASDDKYDGDAGRNWINGKGGNDKINGGAGDDYIIAGAGKDGYVRGGSGFDIFQFGIGDGDIKIFDWEDGIDQIRLMGGLTSQDLQKSTSSYNGTTTVVLSTVAGDRLMIRDHQASEIDAADFIM